MSVFISLKHAARASWRAPASSAIVIVVLGLGIGATTAIFSVVNSVLLTPLPYQDWDRIVALWQRAPESSVSRDWLSPGQYSEILEQSSSFEELALFFGGPILLTLQGPAEEVGFLVARASFFRVLGAKAQLGRLFTVGDDQGDAPMVAVLSHELWQRRYGGDPGILGKSVGTDAYSFEVVGILEPGLPLDGEAFPVGGGMNRYDIVLSMPRTVDRMNDWENEAHNIIGKLRHGVNEAQAQAEMDVISRRLEQQGLQQLKGASVYVDVVPLMDQVVGGVRAGLWMLLGAASLLLLIACMNVTNLLLARGVSRRRELGIYAAIGAGRARIVTHLLMENAVLAFAGCALGVCLAWCTVAIVRRVGPVNLPRLQLIEVDAETLTFAILAALGTAVLSGGWSASRVVSVDASELVKGLRSTNRVLPKRIGTSGVIVIAQVSVAFVLLLGAGLLVRSYARLLAIDPGFAAEGRLTLRLQEPPARDRSPEEGRAVAAELFGRVSELTGVRSVAAATPLPFGQGAIWGPIEVDGYVAPSDEPPVIADRRFVSPEYFETMGIRLVAGRLFDERDTRPDAPPVRIIDRLFAEHFWPGQNAMGKWIGSENARFRENRRGMIVGIVEHVRHYGLESDGRMTMYLPDGEINRTYLIVRADVDPDILVKPVTEVVRSIDPQIVITDVRTMEGRLSDARAQRRLGLLIMQSFAGIALVLGAIGLYGVVAHGVSDGTPEIGLRMALGASVRNILRLVLSYGALIASLGLAIGFFGSLMVTRLIESRLYGVSPADPVTYFGTALVLGAVCILACWIPARRAARVDPATALRNE
ncbi:MAG TPA: ABC transporter permease [Vicinamibacteria bacterium]|nr:ABC transporter permease [Vicinamibacteria bacterium]